MDILGSLNAQQKEAVLHRGSPLMIVAGAGTGKTTVLTRRIAHIITHDTVPPKNIMAVTFTQKAAAELVTRIGEFIPEAPYEMVAGTFHGVCEGILREYGHDIGLPVGFTVLTEHQAWMLVKQHLSEFDLQYYRPRGNPTQFVQSLLTHFSRCKDELVTWQAYIDYVEELRLNTDTATEQFTQEYQRLSELAHAYKTYEELLLKNSYLDFGSLLLYTVELIQNRPNILEKLQEKFAHIIVDEFQDTNYAQYSLLQTLCDSSKNNPPEITVVGDDNQSIYRFRGATIGNILRFTDDFPKTKQVVLIQNYRSTQGILDLAYQLISHNNPHTLESRLKIDKQLVAQRTGTSAVQYITSTDAYSECIRIAQHINVVHDSGAPWNSIGILIRAHHHAEEFKSVLPKQGIPIAVHGPGGFFEHPIVLYCLAVLTIITNAHESQALFSVLDYPPFRLHHEDRMALIQFAKRKGISLYQACQNHQQVTLSDQGHAQIEKLASDLRFVADLRSRVGISECIIQWLERSGAMQYFAKAQEDGSIEEPFVALESFCIYSKEFERLHTIKSVEAFLAWHDDVLASGGYDQQQEVQRQTDAVQIMTVHGAKGLEFDHVILPQLVHLRFPTRARREKIPIPEAIRMHKENAASEHILEERRLAYVAITRARDSLLLSHASNYGGKTTRKPSQFITEMGLDELPDTQTISIVSSEAPTPPAARKPKAHIVGQQRTPKRMSFSQLQTYVRCPLQYKYRYVLRVPTEGNHALSFGSTIHNTLQAWMEKLKILRSAQQQGLFDTPQNTSSDDGSVPDVQELLNIYHEKWIDDWYQNEQQKKEYQDHGVQILKTFYEHHQPFPQLPQAIEQSFTIPIGNCTFTGRIDRIDKNEQGVTIIDYKTGEPKTTLQKIDKQQLHLYHLALKRDPRLAYLGPVNSLEYWYLKDHSIATIPADTELLLEFEQEVITVTDQIAAQEFDPKPNPFTCRSCDFKTICPYRKL